MSEWTIKRGNTAVQVIPITDADGNAITNLAAATEIKFQFKKQETGAALVEKTVVGGGILVNTPTNGNLELTLLPADTTQDIRTYYMGLQIKWGAEVREVDFYVDGFKTEKLKIVQDIVNT